VCFVSIKHAAPTHEALAATRQTLALVYSLLRSHPPSRASFNRTLFYVATVAHKIRTNIFLFRSRVLRPNFVHWRKYSVALQDKGNNTISPHP